MGTEADGLWEKSPNVRRPFAHGKQNLAGTGFSIL